MQNLYLLFKKEKNPPLILNCKTHISLLAKWKILQKKKEFFKSFHYIFIQFVHHFEHIHNLTHFLFNHFWDLFYNYFSNKFKCFLIYPLILDLKQCNSYNLPRRIMNIMIKI